MLIQVKLCENRMKKLQEHNNIITRGGSIVSGPLGKIFRL